MTLEVCLRWTYKEICFIKVLLHSLTKPLKLINVLENDQHLNQTLIPKKKRESYLYKVTYKKVSSDSTALSPTPLRRQNWFLRFSNRRAGLSE